MDTHNHKPPCYRVGDLLVELGTRHVVRGDREIPMPGLSFDLLLALIRAAPNIVSIDQLMDQVWPGLVVSHETVTQRVKLLRDALGDDSHHPRYLALVRSHGYRLIAPVRKSAARKDHAAPRLHLPLKGLLALLALSLLALGLHDGASVFAPWSRVTTREKSLAVLPFVSLSTDATSADFLANAIHDDLITNLAKIPSLKVTSRVSVLQYANTHKNLRRIGRELGVTNIVEGSVQRIGSRVRINVQMIDAEHDQHLWAETYDRSYSARDMLAMQSDIARSIALELRAAISSAQEKRIAAQSTTNTQAYTEYIRGRALPDHVSWWITSPRIPARIAEKHLRRAIALDPGFAVAHAALARFIMQMDYEGIDAASDRRAEAKAEALRAIELAPDLAEGHLALGYCYYYGPGDFRRALKQIEQAEIRMPGSAIVHAVKGFVLKETGRWQEAIDNLQTAIQLDPRNARYHLTLSIILARLGKHDAAQAQLDQVFTFAPGDVNAAYLQARLKLMRAPRGSGDLRAFFRQHPDIQYFTLEHWWVSYLDHDFAAARAVLQRWPNDPEAGSRMSRDLLRGLTHQYAGKAEQARKEYEQARSYLMAQPPPRRGRSGMRPYLFPPGLGLPLAVALAGLGDKQTAIAMSRQRLEQMSPGVAPWQEPALLADLATIYAMTGEDERAISTLDHLMQTAWGWSLDSTVMDPRFDHLRKRPDFKHLLSKYRQR